MMPKINYYIIYFFIFYCDYKTSYNIAKLLNRLIRLINKKIRLYALSFFQFVGVLERNQLDLEEY
jgi:hypothetical protein